MRRYIRHVTIHPLFFLCLAWIVFTDSALHLLLLLLSIALHEAGHLLVYLCAGVMIEEIRLQPFGIAIVPAQQALISRRIQAVCAIAGPMVNLLCAAGGYALLRFIVAPSWVTVVCLSNLFLGLFNLLPILPLDGSRLLDAMIASIWGDYVSQWVCSIISLISGSVLLIFGIRILLDTKMNLSVCMIGGYVLICLAVKIYQFLKKRTVHVKSKS